jgi:hypothetical protein
MRIQELAMTCGNIAVERAQDIIRRIGLDRRGFGWFESRQPAGRYPIHLATSLTHIALRLRARGDAG